MPQLDLNILLPAFFVYIYFDLHSQHRLSFKSHYYLPTFFTIFIFLMQSTVCIVLHKADFQTRFFSKDLL